MVFPVNESYLQNAYSTTTSRTHCSRKEIIQELCGLLNAIETSGVEATCRCTDPKNPPPGTKVVTTDCLDGKEGLMKLIPSSKDRIIWRPPKEEDRPLLDPSHSCYPPTVAKGQYNCHIGLAKDGLNPPSCNSGGHPGEQIQLHCSKNVRKDGNSGKDINRNTVPVISADGRKDVPSFSPFHRGSSSLKPGRDFCEDPTFVAPHPPGHQKWTNEPHSVCRYPESCKAHCFEHSPSRDWARH